MPLPGFLKERSRHTHMSKKKKKRTQKPAPKATSIIPRSVASSEFAVRLPVDNPGAGAILDKRMTELMRQPDSNQRLARHRELVRDYNLALIDKGLACSSSQLKSMDTIDMTAVATHSTDPSAIPESDAFNDPDYVDYVDNIDNMFLRAIPCISSGVLRINTTRYIRFEMKSVDVPGKTFSVWVQDYTNFSGLWSPGVSGTVTASFQADNRSVSLSVPGDDAMTFGRMYRLLDYKKDLHWTDYDIGVWKSFQLKYTDDCEKAVASRNTNGIQELARVFLRYMALLNYYLERNKPKAIRQPVKKKQAPAATEKTEQLEVQTAQPPKRLVRQVGMALVTTVKPPKAPTEDSVRHYKTPVWKARGGVRRLKSGKLVPFKESIRHRKALLNQNSEIPQSMIRVINNTPKEKENDG